MIFGQDDWQVVRPEGARQAPLSGHRDISPTHQRKQAPLIYPGTRQLASQTHPAHPQRKRAALSGSPCVVLSLVILLVALSVVIYSPPPANRLNVIAC